MANPELLSEMVSSQYRNVPPGTEEARYSPPRARQGTSTPDGPAHTDSPQTMDDTPGPEALHRAPQELMQLIQNLRHTGAEKYVSLPKICVVGDQSTGKSSLIEAISGLKSPRDAGACTRCPFELNLHKSDLDWKCEVWLAKSYAYDADPKSARVTKLRPLGFWKEQELENIRFGVLTSEKEVHETLQRAQLALLNPDKDPSLYLPGSNAKIRKHHKVQFSPNVIRLDIYGPAMSHLSLYDLPGVISQDEEEYIPQLTQNLVKKYINTDNCIILLTQTMNHDVANSRAASIIKEMEGRGRPAIDRTIGILTKPDLLEEESIPQFKAILSGRKYRLAQGYHVVRNQANATIEHKEARDKEKWFFNNDPRFSDHLAAFSDRFGTERLQHILSEKLADEIKSSLPRIIKEINAKIEVHCNKRDRLPQPPENNVAFKVQFRIVTDFNRELEKQIEGVDDANFFTKWLKEFGHFRNKLITTRPHHIFRFKSGIQDLDPDTNVRSTHGQERRYPSASNPDCVVVDSDSDPDLDIGGQLQGNRVCFTPGLVRKLCGTVSKGIVGGQDSRVTERLHVEGTKHWPMVAEQFLNTTYKMCQEALEKSIDAAFGPWKSTRLVSEINIMVRKYMGKLWLEMKHLVATFWDMESNKVMAADSEMIMSLQDANLKELKCRWTTYTIHDRARELEIRKNRKVNPAEIKAIRDQVGREPSISWANELAQLALSRAYYTSTASRFADNIGLCIRTKCFHNLRHGLHHELIDGLGFNESEGKASENCKELLAVDQRIIDEREELQNAIKSLEQGKVEIEKVMLKREPRETTTADMGEPMEMDT